MQFLFELEVFEMSPPAKGLLEQGRANVRGAILWQLAGHEFCRPLTGYLNDVSQPMLDEISPDWAWPMKLRRREAW